MKLLSVFSLIVVLMTGATRVAAQGTDDPTTWKYEVKRLNGKEFELIFHCTVKKGWHVWSMKPGGDGSLIAPTFNFNGNPNVNLEGKIMEKGTVTTTTMEGIDGKVTYLSGEITYVQKIRITKATKVTGKHTYQTCSSNMCLRPVDKEFSFALN